MIRSINKWFRNDDAAVAVEMGMILPLMLTILMGMFDVGNAVLTSQKVIKSAQTVGDLLGRYDVITDDILNDTVEAGKLMIWPNDTTAYGIEVVGIQFDGGPNSPTEIWRDTINMSPNADIVTNAVGLGSDTEGVLGVTVTYEYSPFFTNSFVGDFDFIEVSYVRGRSGLFITRG